MDKAIMNVTPAEFANLQEAAFNLRAPDFERFLMNWYGCKPYTEYKVVVRTDVPQVPWFSANVYRFEPLTDSEKGITQ